MNHHAYLIVTAPDSFRSHLPPEVQVPCEDVTHHAHSQFGIAEARALVSEAWRKPLRNAYRDIVLVASAITFPAQNALLKLFEEPPPTTRLYLVVSPHTFLIDTLRSRLHVLVSMPVASPDNDSATSFLAASYRDRLALVASHHHDESSDWFYSLLEGIAGDALVSQLNMVDFHWLCDMLEADLRVGQGGASRKMLFEHLALSLPQR